MKKKSINLWLLAAIVCGLSLGISSCKDDDDLSEEQKRAEQQAQQAEQSEKFWSVVGQLVSMNDATDDYANKTFEPIIGIEDSSDSQMRIVYTNSAAAAAERFANLVDVTDVTESTLTYEWSDSEVGTLTYRKVTNGTAWAVVDVSIKQVPHLSQIIYREPTQSDENGGVTNGGRAYYRFGDVVSKTNADGRTEYWVCVRPAFDPEGKGDTHWITVSKVPKANQWSYKASNGTTYILPTKLGTSKEHMQNLAELLFAIYNPQVWARNVTNYATVSTFGSPKGMKIFHDFHSTNLKYHNALFWQKVQDAWRAKGICNKVFGLLDSEMETRLKGVGIYMLYAGYSWNTWTKNGPTLYQAHYFNTAGGENANMQTKDPYSEVQHDVLNKKDHSQDFEFDITTDAIPYIIKDKFFGDIQPRFIIRFATGAELSSTGKYANNQMPIAGVEEVYRYYRDAYPCTNLDQKPEVTSEQDGVYQNRAYYCPGDVVEDESGYKYICVQSSGRGTNYADQQPYSYFVSFDSHTLGTDLSRIPSSKNQAAQILFDLEFIYHNYIRYPTASYNTKRQNMADNADVVLTELVAMRDTLHKFSHLTNTESVPCDFVSTLYREGGQLKVLRLVADYTAEQESGGRDMSWHFYDQYTATPARTMLLSDLADASVINSYSADKWVKLPWYDYLTKQRITANTGRRTQTENVADLSRFVYQKGRTAAAGTVPANMYREPLIVFRVMRVKDVGKAEAKFENGTAFKPVKLVKEIDDEMDDDVTAYTGIICNTYEVYKSNRIYLNEQNWQFGMAN